MEETRAYVGQRLRIAGSNRQQVFDPDALTAIHRYSAGIPRVVNLLCEHCLVSAFVDRQNVVASSVVEAVARDFDLGETSSATGGAGVHPTLLTTPSGEKLDLVAALKTLITLADRLRESEQDLSKEKK
jgi:hypothetical protein